jgi:hypothetical protein
MFIPKKYLTETIILVENSHMIDPNHIFQILTQDKTANLKRAGVDPITQYYKKLAEKAKQGKNGQKSLIVLDKFKLSKRAEAATLGFKGPHYLSLGTALVELKALMDRQGGYDPKSDKSNVIQITTLELLSQVLKMPVPKPPEPDPEDPEDPEEPDPKPDPDPKSGSGRDWTAYRAKKLASGKPTSEAFKEFYDEYYSIEYAGVSSPEKDTKGIVAKLRSLDKILTIEFNKLGYNPEANPFASFLKILIKEKETGKSNIFDKLTYNTYGAVHNAFIEKYITGNMLGQKFDETNILFCSDLYNKNGLDMVEYLHLQKQVRASKEKSEAATDNNLIAKIFIHQNISTEQDGEELSYSAKVEKLRNLDKVIQPGHKEAKLKSLLEIRELYRYIFGEEAETTENKQKYSLQVKAYIVDDAEKRGYLLDMIDYILDQAVYAESRAYAEEARKFEAWLSKINHKGNPEKKRTVKKVLSNYKLSAAEYHDLIVNLQNRAAESSGGKK